MNEKRKKMNEWESNRKRNEKRRKKINKKTKKKGMNEERRRKQLRLTAPASQQYRAPNENRIR